MSRSWQGTEALNFGPHETDAVIVRLLADAGAGFWSEEDGRPAPTWTALSSSPFQENPHLTLDSRLAADRLGWTGVLGWREAVAMTLGWYRKYLAGIPASELMRHDLGLILEPCEVST